MKAGVLLAALALATAAPMVLPRVALAQEDVSDPAAEAKKQFGNGSKAFAAGRFVEAALAFEAAHFYKPNAVALYTAAIAWEQANQPERAADAFTRALDAQGLSQQQIATAKERIAALEKSLGTLVVTGPDGGKVQLDALTEVPVPARLHAAPGSHTLTVRLPGAKAEKRDVNLEVGQSKDLDVTPVKVEPKPDVPLPPPPKPEVVVDRPAPSISATKAIGFTALGVGVASAVSALVFGLQAVSAGDAYDVAPTRQGFDHANALATWSTVMWISAGVFVAGGITLVLLPAGSSSEAKPVAEPKPDDQARLVLAPSAGGLVLRGAF